MRVSGPLSDPKLMKYANYSQIQGFFCLLVWFFVFVFYGEMIKELIADRSKFQVVNLGFTIAGQQFEAQQQSAQMTADLLILFYESLLS